MGGRNSFDMKRLVDIVISACAFVVLSPVLIVISIFIKVESKGSILYKQERGGKNASTFTIYKFRSMKVHASSSIVKQATKNDSRITKVGSFIRKTSIDELPQLINILKGDMSIVGPRPHAVSHDLYYSKLISNYSLRYQAKPGLTGLAQIKGFRGETETLDKMKQRVRYDLEYIESRNILLDVKIMVLTLFYGVFNKNAH